MRSALLPLLLAVACKPSGSLDATAVGDDDDATSETSGPFWGLINHRLEVFFDEEADRSLINEPTTYVHADIVLDNVEYSDVGFRIKGGYGSFIPWEDGKKSAFILDMNVFVDGQDHMDMKKLVANNMVQDPTFIHEYAGYALFREVDVPASRTTWTEVRINDKHKGLYAFIEPNDADEFLEDHFGNDDGNLYEGAYGADLYEWGMWEYDLDNGDDVDLNHVWDLVATLDGIGTDDPYPVLQAEFDMPSYLRFAATELYLGHWDGYAWTTNNYKIHRDEDGEWTFMPWGLDQTFGDWLGDRAGVLPEPGSDGWMGRIHQLCLASTDCRSDLADAFEEVLDTADAMNLGAVAKEADVLVADFRTEEEWADEATSWTFDFIDQRAAGIRQWLPCLRGGNIDLDGDGFNGCDEDCNDYDVDVHPGALETCDLRDEDCNDILDDPPECPKCVTDGWAWEFSFCFAEMTWDEANQHCRDQGEELASIHDWEDWEMVSWGAWEQMPRWDRWVGLNDQALEGDFAWSDGTDLGFETWGDGAPQFPGDSTDCVVNTPEGWFDDDCSVRRNFVCR